MNLTTSMILLSTLASSAAWAREFHVSIQGDDRNEGSTAKPLRTIQRAADLAQPGDVITVHEGTYRERINPPRGGESDSRRITYQAAPGEKVEIKGSEIAHGWVKVKDDVWKVVLPNARFGDFNPYKDLIHGDWFDRRGRDHHTGAVYLDGEWLTEAASLDDVLRTVGTASPGPAQSDGRYLLNVAWLQPEGAPNSARVSAARFASQQGVQSAPCSEGGECIGWIEHGDWARYERIDFGARCEQLILRAASVTEGGVIEVHRDKPDGELLGTCAVTNTGDWQAWASFHARLKPVSGLQTICLTFRRPDADPLNARLWFAQVDASNTTIWAQFGKSDPNQQLVEINVRRTVFYPDRPGRNYLTVRGFALRHAATPWAPPTAEQIGLIGTHWSKGWIIENNRVSHSVCSGIALGKHGDAWDNTSADTAEGYVKTIERAHTNGWNQATIGHHVVRNNNISHCEQAGIVGSLGAAFSTVTGNTIHDIHVRRLFSGAEMAGIKFHAAIDTTIRSNHIYRTCRGLWLDWMAQGTRVSGNLFHDNASEDLFVEVNHGPFLVDNNVFLSNVTLLDMSEGGAYVHNLMAGRIISRPEPSRETPFHPAHSTAVAGLVTIKGGDNRFFNNLVIGNGSTPGSTPAKDPEWRGGYGLWVYDFREFPSSAAGNVYYHGAQPYARETNPIAVPDQNPRLRRVEEGGKVVLQLELGATLGKAATALVTTDRLGEARVPRLAYVSPDGLPVPIDTDFFGRKRSETRPTPGPFENPGPGPLALQLR